MINSKSISQTQPMEKQELEFFISSAVWFKAYLPDKSRLSLIAWICQCIDKEDDGLRRKLAELFQINHPIQKKAEESLINFLNREESPTTERKNSNRTLQITRYVDWPATYERSITATPLEYYERKPTEFPDEELISALLSLAETWGILQVRLGNEDRGNQLLSLCNNYRHIRYRGAAYDSRIAQRVRHYDTDTADSIDRAVRLMNHAFDAENDRECFRQLGEIIEQKCSDVFLEIVVLLAIARAVEAVGWTVEKYEDEKMDGKLAFEMKNSGLNLCCRLSKSKPDQGMKEVDRLAWLRKQMGNTSHGLEPDITLQFYRPGAIDNSVYVLGDAKRSKDDDGGYIAASVNKAAAYLAAYGHRMGVKFEDGSQNGEKGRMDPFNCSISPAFTLFFLKGIKKIAGKEKKEKDFDDMFKTCRSEIPSVIAMDVSHLCEEESSSGEWGPSEILKSWFVCIAKQADEYLLSIGKEEK